MFPWDPKPGSAIYHMHGYDGFVAFHWHASGTSNTVPNRQLNDRFWTRDRHMKLNGWNLGTAHLTSYEQSTNTHSARLTNTARSQEKVCVPFLPIHPARSLAHSNAHTDANDTDMRQSGTPARYNQHMNAQKRRTNDTDAEPTLCVPRTGR